MGSRMKEGQESLSMTVLLGQLLRTRRQVARVTVAAIAEASGMSPADIEAVEQGRHELGDASLNRLLRGYGVARCASSIAGTVVDISLADGWVTIRRSRRFVQHRRAADRNLIVYLTLLLEASALPMGYRLPLKEIDLSVLRPALSVRRADVKAHLDGQGVLTPSPVGAKRRLTTTATTAGLFLAAGAVLLMPATASAAQLLPLPGAIQAINPSASAAATPGHHRGHASTPDRAEQASIATAWRLDLPRPPRSARDVELSPDEAVLVTLVAAPPTSRGPPTDLSAQKETPT